MIMGKAFAREMDLYRALTCFKRAHILIPKSNRERLEEIDYDIFLAYYLGNKYNDAIDAFETSSLMNASIETFPAPTRPLRSPIRFLYANRPLDKAHKPPPIHRCQEPETAKIYALETSVNDGGY